MNLDPTIRETLRGTKEEIKAWKAAARGLPISFACVGPELRVRYIGRSLAESLEIKRTFASRLFLESE